MVDSANVQWGEDTVRLDEIDDLDDRNAEFYAVLGARHEKRNEWGPPYHCLYIGMAYHQSVRRRVKQKHFSWQLLAGYHSLRRDRDIIVMSGALVDYSVGRVTHEFIQDTEALLIFSNQPRFNTRHKLTYSGRPLVVQNSGNREPPRKHAASSAQAFIRWKRSES